MLGFFVNVISSKAADQRIVKNFTALFAVFELVIIKAELKTKKKKKIQILLIIKLKLKMIFNYVLILTHYVKTFGFIITIASWRNRFGICKWKYLKNYIETFDIFRKILIEDF